MIGPARHESTCPECGARIPVRHTTVIEATPMRLTDGRTRWRGKRCDGTSIEWVEP